MAKLESFSTCHMCTKCVYACAGVHVCMYSCALCMDMHAFKCLCICVCMCWYVCVRMYMYVHAFPVCAYEADKEQEERSIQVDVLFSSLTQ